MKGERCGGITPGGENSTNPALSPWLATIDSMAAQTALTVNGFRAIYAGQRWVWSRISLPIEFSDLGFTERSKLAQLDRNYLVPGELDRVYRLITGPRRHLPSSIFVNLNHKEKESRSQGFCMIGGALVTDGQGQIEFHVMYRSTEMFQKQTADLLWLDRRLPPEIKTVRFYAASAYIAALHFPIYARFHPHPERFIEILNRSDRQAWIKVGGGIKRSFVLPQFNKFKFRSTRKMYDYYHRHVDLEKRDRIARSGFPILRMEG